MTKPSYKLIPGRADEPFLSGLVSLLREWSKEGWDGGGESDFERGLGWGRSNGASALLGYCRAMGVYIENEADESAKKEGEKSNG